MIRFFSAVIGVITFFIIGFMCALQGMDWINTGYGFHPAIAFPIATVSALVIIWILYELAMEPLASWDQCPECGH